jgi:hypothetical protein
VESILRALAGASVGLLGGSVFGALIAGLCALVYQGMFQSIGFLGFIAIFSGVGALSGFIQWWSSDD